MAYSKAKLKELLQNISLFQVILNSISIRENFIYKEFAIGLISIHFN
jgi:hypothetical protein